METSPQGKPAGSSVRRSRRAHDAILKSAVALFEELGYERMTVDRIALRAGASKATIYRWWPSKGAILTEAFLTAVEPDVGFPDSGSLREDLVGQLALLVRVLGETPLGRMMISLLGEAQHDAALAAALRDGWLEPRRVAGRAVLERAVSRGELRSDLDLDLALDGLYGPIYLRLLFAHSPLDTPALEALVAQQLRGIAARPAAAIQAPQGSRRADGDR